MPHNCALKIHVAGYGIKKIHKYCIVTLEMKKAYSVLCQCKRFWQIITTASLNDTIYCDIAQKTWRETVFIKTFDYLSYLDQCLIFYVKCLIEHELICLFFQRKKKQPPTNQQESCLDSKELKQ